MAAKTASKLETFERACSRTASGSGVGRCSVGELAVANDRDVAMWLLLVACRLPAT